MVYVPDGRIHINTIIWEEEFCLNDSDPPRLDLAKLNLLLLSILKPEGERHIMTIPKPRQ